jgi:hypothetical protein
MSVKDARIKCISGEAIISDLGLRLQRGDVTNVPEESAQNSKDLWRLERIGQVSIRWVRRCAEVKDKPPKPPAPPFVRLSRNKKGPPPKTKPVSESVDPNALARRIRAEMRAEMKAEMDELKSMLGQVLAAQQPATPATPSIEAPTADDIAEAVRGAVKEAVGSIPVVVRGNTNVTGGTAGSVVDEDMPVFIPSTIINPETKGEIDVQSESSDANLDDASEALRAMKKKRSKKSGKKT